MPVVARTDRNAVDRRWLPVLALWPGLAQIWCGQEWLGLILATVFTLNLNAALLTSLLWTEAAPSTTVSFFVVCCAATWLLAMGYSVWWGWRWHPDQHAAQIEKLYRDGFNHYIQEHWNESRRACEQLLTLNEADVDALHLLGMSLSRLGHGDLARRAFRECMQIPEGKKWGWEIERELQRLDRAD